MSSPCLFLSRGHRMALYRQEAFHPINCLVESNLLDVVESEMTVCVLKIPLLLKGCRGDWSAALSRISHKLVGFFFFLRLCQIHTLFYQPSYAF